MKIAGICFGLWAIAVPIAAAMIETSVQKVVESQEATRKEWQEYRLAMEKRVTLIEERQNFVLKQLVQVDSDNREQFNRLNRLEGNGKH
jgi:hypothetical protein